MRRRLWWQICVLDRQASLDRGSDPIITTDSFSTQLPLHVNDEDLIPDDPREVQQRDQYTDMTLSLVCHEAFDIAHRLNYVPAGEFDQSQERTDDTWAQRRGWVVLSQRRIEEKYLRLCDVNVPAQRYTKLVADIIIATLWLFTYRPLQKQPDSPNSVKVPHGGILHLAVEVMEKANQLSKDSCSEPFRWMSTIWVQWHALAVTIAELCVQIEGSTVERAWKVVNPVFEETAAHIADSDKGRLWRPIKKLMNRAQAVRKQHLEEEAARKGSLSTEGALLPMTVPWPNPPLLISNTMEMVVEPQLLDDASGLRQPLQQPGTNVESSSTDWDQWLAAGTADAMNYNNELNQMAWTNWETFVDDFHASAEFLPEQERGIQDFNLW